MGIMYKATRHRGGGRGNAKYDCLKLRKLTRLQVWWVKLWGLSPKLHSYGAMMLGTECSCLVEVSDKYLPNSVPVYSDRLHYLTNEDFVAGGRSIKYYIQSLTTGIPQNPYRK